MPLDAIRVSRPASPPQQVGQGVRRRLRRTAVLAGIASWGDIPCYETHVAYRTDTSSARAFLTDFVELP